MKNNDNGKVNQYSKALIKKGAQKYNVAMISKAFLDASNSAPQHEMFNTPERTRALVRSCKGVAYIITALGQKGNGYNWNDAKKRGEEYAQQVRDYEGIVAGYMNSLMYWSVEKGIHFNFEVYIGFLIYFRERIEQQGFSVGLIYKLLNMISDLYVMNRNTYLFIPYYSERIGNVTGLDWEAPVDERRDGKEFSHTNEWLRLQKIIEKRKVDSVQRPKVSNIFL